MKSSIASPLIVAMFLVCSSLRAQEIYRPSDANILARLSYDRTPDATMEVRHVCFAVSREGDFWLVRRDQLSVTTEGSFRMNRIKGKLLQSKFEELTKLLGAADFRALSGDHGGLIRQDAESFGAEVAMPGVAAKDSAVKFQRLQWMSADGENPFPASIMKVIDWLKQFQPKGGEPLDYAETRSVCPSSGLRLVQPSVAKNQK